MVSSVHYTPVFRTYSKSVRQISLNARSGSGSGLLDNACFASCRSSILGLSAISTMAEHRLCSTDHIQRREEPHAVDKPNQALLIAAWRDLIVDEGVQQQIRRAHYKISVNGFPLRDLACDALKTILGALGVYGGAYRGAASYEGPQEQ